MPLGKETRLKSRLLRSLCCLWKQLNYSDENYYTSGDFRNSTFQTEFCLMGYKSVSFVENQLVFRTICRIHLQCRRITSVKQVARREVNNCKLETRLESRLDLVFAITLTHFRQLSRFSRINCFLKVLNSKVTPMRMLFFFSD